MSNGKRSGRPVASDPRAFPVMVRLTGDEYLALEARARLEGVSNAELLRRHGLAPIVRGDLDVPAISRRA